MTQGFPAQPQYAQQPQQFAPPQGYAPPAQPQYTPPVQQAGGFTVPAPVPQQQAAPFFTQQDPHIQAQQGPSVPPAPQPGATQQTDTTGFWGGAASISFDAQKGYVKGSPRGGQILSKSISDQTKMGTGEVIRWKDGSPRKQMVLLLQTTERSDPQDNGQRQLFIKGDLPRATREAFQAVGATDVEIGGWLYAAWVDDKPPVQSGYSPQKIYKCIYAPPGSPDPLAGQHVPTPPPSASADQFAQHAAYQQHGVVLVQPNGAPAQQFVPQAPAQPQQSAFAQAVAPEVANMPNPVQQAYQQAQQFAPQPGAQQNPPGQFTPQPQPNPSGQQPEWTPFG